MGYRLGIDKIETQSIFYGTKLYGYVSNIEELESIKWLKSKCYIENPIGFECDGEMPIIMSVRDFREFVKLYNIDYNKYSKNMFETYEKDAFIKDENIQKILNMPDDDRVLLTWG